MRNCTQTWGLVLASNFLGGKVKFFELSRQYGRKDGRWVMHLVSPSAICCGGGQKRQNVSLPYGNKLHTLRHTALTLIQLCEVRTDPAVTEIVTLREWKLINKSPSA